MSDNLVTFENVGLRYGLDQEVLKDINLKIDKGDFLFLGGESGAGKSSLLNLMNLSVFPSRGFLSILEKDVFDLNGEQSANVRRKIGIIFQDFRLIKHLSIFDNIALPLVIEGIDKEEIESRVMEILQWIGLKDSAKLFPIYLSGGQQQRVAVARAIINQPSLILADEPTGSIDSKIANKILLMLEELNSQGVSVVFATHNADLLNYSEYNVAMIKNSRLEIIR